MLYSEIIAVCSQINTKHINTMCGQKVELLNVKLLGSELYINIQSVPRSNTLRHRYKNQSINIVWGNNRCLFSHPHKIHKYTVWADGSSQVS
jgi:hypothetical protein